MVKESLSTSKTNNLANKKICPEVNFLYCNKKEYDDASWRLCQVHNIPNLNPITITEVINQKNTKAQEYTSCDKYWLLIIVDFWDPAQDQTMYLDDDLFIQKNLFEKVIIFKPATGEIIER